MNPYYLKIRYEDKTHWGYWNVYNDMNPWLSYMKTKKWQTGNMDYGNHYQ